VHGKVTTWFMTPEQLADYVKKHPIIESERPKGSTFADVKDAQYRKAKQEKLIDKLRELYLSGMSFPKIAEELSLGESTVKNWITEQRKMNPEKWPRRQGKNKTDATNIGPK
jgi:DNA invertase Pin-like site-specific DNA recombinase